MYKLITADRSADSCMCVCVSIDILKNDLLRVRCFKKRSDILFITIVLSNFNDFYQAAGRKNVIDKFL